jgi:uncharacterized protein YjiS (DUF1127 family)
MDVVIGRRLHANAGLLERARRAAWRLASAMARSRDQRRQQRAFERLDDRLLADIGLTRTPQLWEAAQWVWWV